MLEYVIQGSIYMSHYEIDEEDIGRADQCGNQVVEASAFPKRGSQGTGGRPRRIETAGLSLCPGSEGNETCRGIAGDKSGVHGKTSGESSGEGKAVSEGFRRNDQYDSHTSNGEVSSKRALKWLNLWGQIAWSWSIALTDCPARRFPRSTGFWCRGRRYTNLIMTYS